MTWQKAQAYPAPRSRPVPGPPVVAGQYAQMQTTGGYLTLGDTLAEVITFAGTPDSVTVAVETFDAVIVYGTRGRPNEDQVVVRAGQVFAPDVAVEIVRARNNVPGSNATVQVIGKWLTRTTWPI